MSNDCILVILITEKKIKQRFNYITVKLIKCNINNKYSSSSAVKSISNYKRTEKDKRKIKKKKKITFILN